MKLPPQSPEDLLDTHICFHLIAGKTAIQRGGSGITGGGG